MSKNYENQLFFHWMREGLRMKDLITFLGILEDLLMQILFNPLTINVLDHIETSQLICIPNQLTGFSMMGNSRR